MRNVWRGVLVAALVVTVWAADWPMPGGNPQRNGWAGSERRISKANVSALRLLYKYQTDNQSKGSAALTAPIISGNLITYRGFKEMLLFGGSSDKLFSVDADLNRLLWEARLPYAGAKQGSAPADAACAGGMTAPVVMEGSSSSSLHFAAMARRAPAPGPPGTRRYRPSPYLPPLAQSVYPLLPTTLSELNALYAVSSDGQLHVINSSTGEDLLPPVRFLPPHPKVTSLNIRDNVVYATTANHCDGYLNALFAIDLLSPEKTVHSFIAPQGEFAGSAAAAIGNDGTVYLQLAYAAERGAKRYYETVVALRPKDLAVKDYFVVSKKAVKNAASQGAGISPVVFSFPGRDLILAGSREGRLYLLDSRALGGADHRTPLFMSAVLSGGKKKCPESGFRGGFSTWFDVENGTRRIYVPLVGPLREASKSKTPSAVAAVSGSILAFQLAGTNEQPTLKPIWTSRNLISPTPVVIANGMVFALATGAPACTGKRHPADSAHSGSDEQAGNAAVLYAIDALTGKELFSSGDTGARVSDATGLALANGRLYFTAQDNAVYCFGIPGQQRQLVEQ